MTRPVSHGEAVAMTVAILGLLIVVVVRAYELAHAERPVHVHFAPAGAR